MRDRAALAVGNGEALPLASASFDVVTCVYLFHELPLDARRRGLAEARRVSDEATSSRDAIAAERDAGAGERDEARRALDGLRAEHDAERAGRAAHPTAFQDETAG